MREHEMFFLMGSTLMYKQTTYLYYSGRTHILMATGIHIVDNHDASQKKRICRTFGPTSLPLHIYNFFCRKKWPFKRPLLPPAKQKVFKGYWNSLERHENVFDT